MKETLKKVLLGRGKVTVLAVVVVLTVLGTSTALAGTGVGAAFHLGQMNTVDALSRLVGSTNDALLRITNTNTGTAATALDLRVTGNNTIAPMTVNSSAKVEKLNADFVDGKSSSEFLGATQKAADADKLDGNESSAFLGANQKATDADKLDGKDSTQLMGSSTYKNSITITGTSGYKADIVYCNPGDRVLSGGHYGLRPGSTIFDSYSLGYAQQDGWHMQIYFGSAHSVIVYVLCADM